MALWVSIARYRHRPADSSWPNTGSVRLYKRQSEPPILPQTDPSLEMELTLCVLSLLGLLLSVGPSRAQTNKFSPGRSFYQVVQPQVPTGPQLPQSASQLPVSGVNGNIFNQRATILYKPQTVVVLNDGQEKEGDCPVTRPATGYSSFKQVRLIACKKASRIDFSLLAVRGTLV